jgi:hypothetical protein
MKRNILALVILFVISMTSAFSQRESRFIDMHFISGGELVLDSGGKITSPSFWISNQITNKEFREFLDYAKNNPQEELMWAGMSISSARNSNSQPKIMKIKYSELLKDTLNTTNWPTENYYESPEYNDSPVIGVSEELGKLYCIWKTTMVYDNLNESEKDPVFPYYPATALQMKYARNTNPTLFSDKEVGFRITIME